MSIRNLRLLGALSRTFLCTVSAFSLSQSVQSQAIISFKTCVDATALAASYAQASQERASEQLANNEIPLKQHQQISHEISDFQQTFTLERCMQGADSAVYFCLLEHQGNFSGCRS